MAQPQELEFVEFLKKIGNGEATQYPQYGENVIEIPQELVGDEKNIIEEIFEDISETILTDRVLKPVVLAPTNEDCSLINSDMLNRIPGEQKIYHIVKMKSFVIMR